MSLVLKPDIVPLYTIRFLKLISPVPVNTISRSFEFDMNVLVNMVEMPDPTITSPEFIVTSFVSVFVLTSIWNVYVSPMNRQFGIVSVVALDILTYSPL